MEKDDENYEAMEREQRRYVAETLITAKQNGVQVTPWEVEEIELAFEKAFAIGFNLGRRQRKESRAFKDYNDSRF